jgi:carbonic anhydrase
VKDAFFTVALHLALILSGAAQQPDAAPMQQSEHHIGTTHQSPSPDQIWADLMEGNRRFVTGRAKSRELIKLREGLRQGQHPKAVVLACSDSRVSPELIFDQSLGDLAVVRSAGNVVDSIGVGSIEYAVEHLGSTVLVVLGHTECGAVTEACSKKKVPSSNLQAIMNKIDPAVWEAGKTATGDTLIEAAIRANVHQSARDVLASSEILWHLVADGKLKVFEVEYQLETGRVVRLDTGRP